MSDKYQSADLILKLYELRREEKMREARAWFAGFMPESAEEIMQTVLNPETSAYFRMVTSYWDMAASFVNHGAIDEAMFNEVSGEGVLVFAKLEPFLAEMREMSSRPKMYKNLEDYVTRMEGIEETLPKLREMMKKWGDARTKQK